MTKKTGKKAVPKGFKAQPPAKAGSKNVTNEAVYAQSFTAHFSDCDPERILFFATYFKWAHDAIEGLMHNQGLWDIWFDHKEWGAPLRHVEADYMSPLKFGETADCLVHVANVGETSVTFECHFVGGINASTTSVKAEEKSAPRLLAVTRTVHVFVDRKKMRPTKVPTEVIKNLK